MLRFRVLALASPLLALGGFAATMIAPAPALCIMAETGPVQLTSAPWQAHQRVAFTDDPAHASIRITLTDDPAAADLAIADDTARLPEQGCDARTPVRSVMVTATPTPGDAVIYLARETPGDYQLFVQSTSITPMEAAALLLASKRPHAQLAAAQL